MVALQYTNSMFVNICDDNAANRAELGYPRPNPPKD